MKETVVNQALKWSIPALVFAALALPATVSAQSSADMQRWKTCVGDQELDTENARAYDPDAFRGSHANELLTVLAQRGEVLDTRPESDEVVLDFKDDIDHEDVLAWGEKNGLSVRLNSIHSDEPNVYIATVDEGAVPDIKTCLESRESSADMLESVEENIEYVSFGTPNGAANAESPSDDTSPNDPLYQFQWHFDQVNAEDAWRVSTGRDVVVAVIDTGVALEESEAGDITRPKDLDGTAWVDGYDFVDDDDFSWDGHGHGTHVAGTIAQTTNNEYGVAGLAYDAKIMSLRVLDSRGFGQVADIADAVRYAADNDVQVINMSLGGPIPSLVLSRAIKYAHKHGVTIVAAAGNSGKRAPSYPAAYKHTIAVAATQYDKTTTFYSQWGDFVDIAAPGGNKRVDQNGDGRPDGVLQQTLKDGKTDTHEFVLYMGTSMASPHVAAGAALVMAQGVTHPDKVEEVLLATSDPSERDRFDNPKEFDEKYGSGIMQADQAVEDAILDQGMWRMAGGLLLALLALVGVRRKDMLAGPAFSPQVIGVSVVTASGLFFLPLLVGSGGCFGGVVTALSHPLAELDLTLFGAGAHQNPLLASALIPLAAVGLLGGHKKLRLLASGVALGMAGFLLTETFLMTSDVQWVPGMDLLDRIWLAGNGLVSAALGYFNLKRY